MKLYYAYIQFPNYTLQDEVAGENPQQALESIFSKYGKDNIKSVLIKLMVQEVFPLNHS